MAGRISCTLVQAVVLLSCFVLHAQLGFADVGVEDGSYKINKYSIMEGKKWNMIKGVCTVGVANNIVVDPQITSDFLSLQSLEMRRTGPKLCMWLERLYASHHALRSKWEKALALKKSRLKWYELYERWTARKPSFPEFRAIYQIEIFDLWHDDRFGNPFPWVRGAFHYLPPDPHHGFGVFDVLTSVFSVSESGAPAQVHILLTPNSWDGTFFQDDDSGLGLKEAASAVLGGLGGLPLVGMSTSSIRQVVLPFISSNVPLSLALNVQDFWNNGSFCHIRSRLYASGLAGMSVCSYINERLTNIVDIIKYNLVNSVHLTVVGFDLFQQEKPGIECEVDEGMIASTSNGIGGVPQQTMFFIDSYPQLRQAYKRVTPLQKNVGLAVSALQLFM